jgi:hypothetical protein
LPWKVTVRHGPAVSREKTDSLDDAIAEARRAVDDVRREGGLPAISAMRDFSPDQRVHARIELSGPGFLRGKEGGIDVMGDGSLVAYTGAIRREALPADSLDEATEKLREALA